MSDKFKLFDEIYERDIRQNFFAILDSSGSRNRSLMDLYKDVSKFVLHPNVPEAIQVHFDTAKNILLYSWFVYRFLSVAETQAYSSLEYALRLKLGIDRTKEYPGLARLLKVAIEEKFISDSQIRMQQRIIKIRERALESDRMFAEAIGQPFSEPPSPDPQEYCKILCDTFPMLRNALAHGSNMVTPSSTFITLEICCDLINQLFPLAEECRNPATPN
jgi:hypothetical protein